METRIAIDARMMSSNFGIGRYIQQLTKHLEQTAPDTMEFFLFMKRDNWNEFKPQRDNFQKVLADINWYGVEEQLKMPNKIRQVDPDLVHFPHWNIPLFYRGKFVVTIHDLIMFHFPRPEATTRSRLIYWFKDKVHRYLVKKAVTKSHHIITPSNFTKEDILTTFGVDQEKISVIYQAPFEEKTETEKFKQLKQSYNLERPYVFYLGSAYPHKNLENLLQAWQQFQQQETSQLNPDKYQLILAGKKDYFYKKLVESKLYQNNSNLTYIGAVSDSELKTLYKEAELFVFPSLYEGFGLPPLEALTENTPSLVSDKASLPEVLQECANYTDTTNPDQFAKDLEKILTDKSLQKEILSDSKQLLDNYSWKQLSKDTLDVYKRALQD